MSNFRTFEVRTARPVEKDATESKPFEERGFGIAILEGGGDGVEVFFGKGDDSNPLKSSRGVGNVKEGALIPADFDRIAFRWPDIGLDSSTTIERRIKYMVFKEKAIGRVQTDSPDELKTERKFIYANNSTLMGSSLAAGSSHVVFDTISDYLPAKPNRITNPGPAVPWREEEAWIELVLGGKSAGAALTQAPIVHVQSYGNLLDGDGNRFPCFYKHLTAIDPATIPGIDQGTNWEWSLMSMFGPTSGVAAWDAGLGSLMIPHPPNGARITIHNPSGNPAALIWEGYSHVRGGL